MKRRHVYNGHRPWTEQEDAELIRSYMAGDAYSVMEMRLKRPGGSGPARVAILKRKGLLPADNPTTRKRQYHINQSDACEHMTAPTAQKLAQSIEAYWHKAGHKNVQTWIEFEGYRFKLPVYSVRSNLVGGRPPVSHGNSTERSTPASEFEVRA